MCLDFAARVLARDGDVCLVETEGRKRRASALLVPETAVGDWVLVALGTIVRLLDPTEARLINQSLRTAQGAAP